MHLRYRCPIVLIENNNNTQQKPQEHKNTTTNQLQRSDRALCSVALSLFAPVLCPLALSTTRLIAVAAVTFVAASVILRIIIICIFHFDFRRSLNTAPFRPQPAPPAPSSPAAHHAAKNRIFRHPCELLSNFLLLLLSSSSFSAFTKTGTVPRIRRFRQLLFSFSQHIIFATSHFAVVRNICRAEPSCRAAG